MPTRKQNRLSLNVYREPGTFFVTIATEGRRAWFREPAVVERCAGAIRAACDKEGFDLIAYCFMPDHVHVVVSTEQENDLVRLVHGFKQKTGWWFRNQYVAGGLPPEADPPAAGKPSPTGRSTRPGLWQKSYYDHVLRRDEDLADVVRYVLENPIRAGLVESFDEYPYGWSVYGAPEAG